MTDCTEFRDDLPDAECLENEAESFEDNRAHTKLWLLAAECVRCAGDITIQRAKGRLYVGYHRTLSELTPRQLVLVGCHLLGYKGLLSLSVRIEAVSEAYAVFWFPVGILKDRQMYRQEIKRADKAAEAAYGC